MTCKNEKSEKREPPSTAADAWTEWAQDFGETPSNPRRGSWAALRHCFYGGMLVASVMLGHGFPEEIETVRTRYNKLMAELNEWADADEVTASQKLGIDPVQEDWIETTWSWLLEESRDPEFAEALWNMMNVDDENDDRSLPEMGFGPQLGLAMASLRAIAHCSFPRHDDPEGNENSVPLTTEMRTVAAMVLAKLMKDDSDAGGGDMGLKQPGV